MEKHASCTLNGLERNRLPFLRGWLDLRVKQFRLNGNSRTFVCGTRAWEGCHKGIPPRRVHIVKEVSQAVVTVNEGDLNCTLYILEWS